jgi:hypothetical protein
VLISTTPQPRVENLFGTARLCSDMLTRFPELEGTVTSLERIETQEKANLQLSKKYASSSFAGFPIRAIVLRGTTGVATTRFDARTPASDADAGADYDDDSAERIADGVSADCGIHRRDARLLVRRRRRSRSIPAAIEGILDGELL